MVAQEANFVGEWGQVEPDPHPASILIKFESNGQLRYTVETATIQHIMLTWRVDGDVLVTNQPSAPREERTHFRFTTPSRLVLERLDAVYSYERV